jgi:hypothetical protein
MAQQQESKTFQIGLEHISNVDDFANEKAYEVYVPIDPQHPKTNLKFALYGGITARDTRSLGIETFTLEQNGFRFLKHDFNDGLKMQDVINEGGDKIVLAYLQRLQPVIKQALGAEGVVVYDWRVRKNWMRAMYPAECKA